MVTGVEIKGHVVHLEGVLSPRRFSHSLRVARTAVRMARRYGVSPSRAWMAGLYHDYCREWPPEELIALARHQGRDLSSREEKNPLLLHGWAAAQVLEDAGRICDPEVLRAVTYHVEGASSLEPLGQIIFAADYLEPGRPFHFRDETNLYLSKTLDGLYEWVDQSLRAYYKENGAIEKLTDFESASSLQE